MSRRQRRPRLLGALILLILLGLLLPLGSLLTGFLPGGKSRAEPVPEPLPREAAESLEVTVVRADDLAPVEGARVLVERLTGGESQLESDARGRVRVDGLGAGPVRVEATADGRRAEAWADPAVTRELRLAVGPEPRRTGRVTPAPARVALLGEDGEEIAVTKTDAQGRYDLPDVEGSLCAVAEGFAPAVAAGGDFALREGTLVEGKLMGGGAGALSVTGVVAVPGVDSVLPFRTEWRVAEDGGFRGSLPAGAEAFGMYRGLPVRISAGSVALPAPATAEGVVRRADGSPAAHAVLLFRPLLDLDFATPLPGLRVVANERGEFAATGFAAVRYSVEAYAAGCATRVVPEVAVGKGPIEIALSPGFSIGGFVVDAAGLPVPRARLRAVGLPEEAGRPVLSATADALGRFHIAGLGGTHARLRITAKGYHPTTIERLDPSSTLRVILQVNG
jgi:hypothetical protein